MSMPKLDSLLAALSTTLEPLGFRRRGRNWYRNSGDLYAIVNVQKSDLGNVQYVNIGFSPCTQANGGWVTESKCWVRFRVTSLHGVATEAIELLEQARESDAPSIEVEAMLRAGLATGIGALMREVVDIASLRIALEGRVSAGRFVHRNMRPILWPEA